MESIKTSKLLPSFYVEAQEPSYTGKGNHNVLELEEIAERYKELVHQLRIREQTLCRKFDIKITRD